MRLSDLPPSQFLTMTDSDRTDKQKRADRYLLGRGTPDERSTFEEDLAGDEALRQILNDTESAMAAIELAEDRALKSRLQAIEAEFNTAPVETGSPGAEPTVKQSATEAKEATVISMRPLKRSRRTLLAYAAAVLLLLGVGWVAFNFDDDSPAALAAAAFEPYPNIAYPIQRSDSSGDPEAAAFIAYEAADFATAEREFSQLPPEPKFRFYLAQSLLAQGKHAEAEPLFAEIAANQDFSLAAEAAYYQALTRLGQDDVLGAEPLLQRAAAEADPPVGKQARELLRQLPN